ncbi:MAG: 30S ribosomal protein S9 [Bacteroidales bacterium]|nr:30S ribosomal protein S9 [Bacteroidales bacterium]MBN2757867.1 30S ribosomal protein S9 [Bacteroidales bacterium]
MEVINATGRRKSAIARVYLAEGKGKITVNKRDVAEYFKTDQLVYIVKQPLTEVGLEGNFDIKVNISGGGQSGQAEALRLGIARAIVKISEEHRPALKVKKFLTRDSRVVERKKPGRPKARKRFQFSKR